MIISGYVFNFDYTSGFLFPSTGFFFNYSHKFFLKEFFKKSENSVICFPKSTTGPDTLDRKVCPIKGLASYHQNAPPTRVEQKIVLQSLICPRCGHVTTCRIYNLLSFTASVLYKISDFSFHR